MLVRGLLSYVMAFGVASFAAADNPPAKSKTLDEQLLDDLDSDLFDGLNDLPAKKDTDPVCGKTVTTDRAKPSVYAGNVYYFCSHECREVFEAALDLYAVVGGPDHPKLEHSHA